MYFNVHNGTSCALVMVNVARFQPVTCAGNTGLPTSRMGAKSHRMVKNPLRNRNPQQIHYCWLLLLLLWIAALHHVRAERDINLELQEELLKFLGMKRPLGSKEHRIPNYMHQMYNKNRQIFNTAEDLQRTPNYFNINNHGTLDNVRCLANITEVGNATEIRPGVARITIKFSFEGVPSEELLHSAQLRVTHSPRDFETEESRRNDVNHPNGVTSFMPPEFYPRKYKKDNLPYVNYLRVYDVVRVLDDGEQVLRLLDTTTVDRRNSGIITLDVGPAVSRWVKRPRTNHGLVLEMSPAPTQKKIHKYRGNALSHLRLKRNNHPADDEYWHDIKPSLLLRSDSGVPTVRKKRTANTQPYEKCQRHELYVDFERVDWKSWIFAPRGYSAYYCAGACEFPLATHMNTTNHAIIQTLVNSKYPDRVPKSCCVPTEMSPISLLYKDDYESVTLKNYQNMVVEACGCR